MNYIYLTGLLDKLDDFKVLPASVKVSFDVVYLGTILSDIIEIEIRTDKSTLGWLYGEAKHVIWKDIHGRTFVCDLPPLKQAVELALKEKRFIVEDMPPEINHIQKRGDSIWGFVDKNELVKISKVV